jgi:uncharacterized lipoprotein YajG
MFKTIKKNQIRTILVLALSSALLAACATPKPAPSWPSGKERPINQVPDNKEKGEVAK